MKTISQEHGSSIDDVPRVCSSPTARVQLLPARGTVERVTGCGLVMVCIDASSVLRCEVLNPGGAEVLAVGDSVLVTLLAGESGGVILGRIGSYVPPSALPRVTIDASESLSLRCGEASIDLRADGKVTIRGEDVLVRAKGTQRIRAGTVSIN